MMKSRNTMRRLLHNFSRLSVLVLVVVVELSATSVQAGHQEVATTESATSGSGAAEEQITFAKMSLDQVRTELLQWLVSTGAERETLEAVTLKWADDDALARLSGEELLDLLVESFAQVDSVAARLVQDSYGVAIGDDVIFDGIRAAAIFRNQIQQFRARWMVQHRYYDEALPLLTELAPETVVDPAGLLFYRAVCQSQLLLRQDALDSISLLLNNSLDVPDRFRVVAEMLKQELSGQKDDGMNKVAQLMQDVERRLDLGRSGEKTQQQEDAVIAALDKLLEDMEEQNKKQNGGGGGGGSQQNPSGTQGANQSQIRGAPPATGDADRKELTENGKWGMLDQQAEAKARELIRQKFPSNFLDQIGRYTKKIAEQKK